jgi:hypothetical protein
VNERFTVPEVLADTHTETDSLYSLKLVYGRLGESFSTRKEGWGNRYRISEL